MYEQEAHRQTVARNLNRLKEVQPGTNTAGAQQDWTTFRRATKASMFLSMQYLKLYDGTRAVRLSKLQCVAALRRYRNINFLLSINHSKQEKTILFFIFRSNEIRVINCIVFVYVFYVEKQN